MRRFFWTSKTYVKSDGWEIIRKFTLKNVVYLDLCEHPGNHDGGMQDNSSYFSVNRLVVQVMQEEHWWVNHQQTDIQNSMNRV